MTKPLLSTAQSLSTWSLLRLALCELRAEKQRCTRENQEFSCLKINGHELADVIAAHLQGSEEAAA